MTNLINLRERYCILFLTLVRQSVFSVKSNVCMYICHYCLIMEVIIYYVFMLTHRNIIMYTLIRTYSTSMCYVLYKTYINSHDRSTYFSA